MSTNWSLCITSEALRKSRSLSPPFATGSRVPADPSRTVFLLPIPLLRHLSSLGRGQKAGLVVVFTLGLVTMIVSTGRFITMMCLGTDISLCKRWSLTTYATPSLLVLRQLTAATSQTSGRPPSFRWPSWSWLA